MGTTAILFDLEDTLVGVVARHAAEHLGQATLIRDLAKAMQALT
jgi:hypothetical protein